MNHISYEEPEVLDMYSRKNIRFIPIIGVMNTELYRIETMDGEFLIEFTGEFE